MIVSVLEALMLLWFFAGFKFCWIQVLLDSTFAVFQFCWVQDLLALLVLCAGIQAPGFLWIQLLLDSRFGAFDHVTEMETHGPFWSRMFPRVYSDVRV